MRVGLYIGDTAPSEGGGFTFVENLLGLLRTQTGDGRHEFVVCHQGQAGAQAIAQGFAQLDLRAARNSVLLPRERLPGLVARAWNRLSPPAPTLNWHTRVYRANAIDFVVHLNPWRATSMEVPFASFMWDVQHRNNPWFPEVCELGGWEAREALTSAHCQRASYVFTGTTRGAEEIEFYYRVPRERVRVLPFAVPQFAVDAAAGPARPQLLKGLDLPPRFVLYPAQFWAHKNHVTLLQACRKLHATRPDAPGVVFVGSDKGNLAHVRNQAQALGIAGQSRFLGFVNQNVLVELYRAADALAFPTACGPDNLPPLEAFALGCPVVASSVPGATEQLGDAALLFPPFDEVQLAAHLSSLMDRPDLRATLVERGRERAAGLTGAGYAAGFMSVLDEFEAVRRTWNQ